MKGLFGILLSVMILSLAGCGKATSNTDSGRKEVTETVETIEEVQSVSGQVAEAAEDIEEKASVSDKESEEASLDDSGKGNQTEPASKEEKTVADSSKDDDKSEKEAQSSAATENIKEEKSSEKKEDATSDSSSKTTENKSDTATETKKEQTAEEKKVSYSPDTVVALAIAKCQAGGMITTQDNLAKALAEGRITQEEYNEYYPYDGLEGSYYSVFVETDLNHASTTSGQPLRSEDAIAGYIADMLLLESSPVFNVVYAGTYTKNGASFYEFRCLR